MCEEEALEFLIGYYVVVLLIAAGLGFIPATIAKTIETGRIDAFRLNWKPGMPNQPHIFWDSDVAKWIEAASYSLIYEDSPEIRAALDEAIGIIEKAQQADGYLDTHYILKKPDRKWKEIAHGHELYCTGHMLEAAVAYRAVTGDDRLLRVMEKNVELIRSVFGSEEGKLDSYPGHEEIELALMKAYHATGEKKYLELADIS